MEFLNQSQDLNWLFETHLRFLAQFRSRFNAAMIYGNEDSPTRIDLYVAIEPTVKDQPFIVTLS